MVSFQRCCTFLCGRLSCKDGNKNNWLPKMYRGSDAEGDGTAILCNLEEQWWSNNPIWIINESMSRNREMLLENDECNIWQTSSWSWHTISYLYHCSIIMCRIQQIWWLSWAHVWYNCNQQPYCLIDKVCISIIHTNSVT